MLKDESLPEPPVVQKALSDSSILVAIPAFNEGATIGSVVLKAKHYADEVVVVDDGSTDDTAWVAEQAGAVVLHHKTNKGYGAALRSCFAYGRDSPAAVMVILDGDGQHDPAAIPCVLEPVLKRRADIVIGSRLLQGRSNVPGYRRLGIKVLTALTNLGTKNAVKLKDAQSGFRAYSRKAINILDPRDPDMGASAEIIWDADDNGLRMEEVPIEVAYGRARSTKGPMRHGLGVLGSMLIYLESKHALLSFGVPGLLLFGFGLVLGFYVVEVYQRTSQLAIGLALVTVMLVILGILLVFTGLILHAVVNATKRLN